MKNATGQNSSEHSMFDLVLYIRLGDMKNMCEQLAKQANAKGVRMASRIGRAGKAFEGMMKEIEYGNSQTNLF